MNIGYDFDGVLHPDVGPPDMYGQRYPPLFATTFTSFSEIMYQIKKQLKEGNKVFIITARFDTNVQREAIKSHLLKNQIDPNKIELHFTSNKDKTPKLNELQINIYYDDSCLRILELFNKRESIPTLRELYYVQPEERRWTLVTESNINCFCPNLLEIQTMILNLNPNNFSNQWPPLYIFLHKIINHCRWRFPRSQRETIRNTLSKLQTLIKSNATVDELRTVQIEVLQIILSGLSKK